MIDDRFFGNKQLERSQKKNNQTDISTKPAVHSTINRRKNVSFPTWDRISTTCDDVWLWSLGARTTTFQQTAAAAGLQRWRTGLQFLHSFKKIQKKELTTDRAQLTKSKPSKCESLQGERKKKLGKRTPFYAITFCQGGEQRREKKKNNQTFKQWFYWYVSAFALPNGRQNKPLVRFFFCRGFWCRGKAFLQSDFF